MQPLDDAVRLRIYVAESDTREDRPLFEQLVEAARRRGLAGACALRGLLGFAATDLAEEASGPTLAGNPPIVVEVVDLEDRIEAFLPLVDELVDEGLVTLEAVRVHAYRPRASRA